MKHHILEGFTLRKFVVLALSALLTLTLQVNVFAAPFAEMSMNVSDVVDTGDGLEFTLNIDISEPSEPYSSLDFNLVSSDYECLAIVDNSQSGDRSDLDITFAPGYGNAYHKGRIDDASNAVSYLLGVFSSSGGNAITGETNICGIRMHYTGQAAQELSIRDLKLIYKTSDGLIDSVAIESDALLTVTPDIYVEIARDDTPLSQWPEDPVVQESSDDGPGTYWYIAGIIIVIAAISGLVIKRRKNLKAGK